MRPLETREQRRRLLETFTDSSGAVTGLPGKEAKRRVVLEHVVQAFDVGTYYSEPEVNDLLARHAPDVATLRRYLVDHGLLSRSAGSYWRSGGEVTDLP